ncbi:hypothetical protein V6N13_132638 [Hibiscus sabdariffa]
MSASSLPPTSHAQVMNLGWESYDFVLNESIHLEMFDQMLERNAVSWSSMISVYVHMGMFREALELFNDMQLCGFRPNHAGIVGALAACAFLDLSIIKSRADARKHCSVNSPACYANLLLPSALHLLVHSSTMGLSRYIHDKPVDAQAFRPRGASEALDH